ncbi:hypothetical protein ACFGWM_03325 [Pasteurella multocida]
MLLIFFVVFWAELSFAEANMLPLCHADQLYSEYNYGGIWERDEDGEWICNFWQFLPEGQNERPTTIIGAEESEESDFYISPQSEEPELIEYYDDGE